MLTTGMTFANFLKRVMELSNIKASQISRVTKYEVSTVYKWISGDRLPATKNFADVADSMSEYLITREEEVLKRLAKFINSTDENGKHKIAEKLNKESLVEAFLNSLEVSKKSKYFSERKGEYVPSYFKNCKNVFTVSSFNNIIDAYNHSFTELHDNIPEHKNILIVSGIFDRYVSISQKDLILLKNIRNLINLGYELQTLMLVDAKRQDSTNYILSLLNILNVVGIKNHCLKFADTNSYADIFKKVCIVPDNMAIISVCTNSNIIDSSMVIYDKETVNTLYASYINCLSKLKNVFDKVDVVNPFQCFDTPSNGKLCCSSDCISISLLDFRIIKDCLVREEFSEVTDKINLCLLSWEKYYFGLKDIYYLLNVESLEKFILNGNFFINDEVITCSIDTRVLVLESLLNLIKQSEHYHIALYYSKEVVTSKNISRIIIHGNKLAYLKLKDEEMSWIRVSEEYFVDGLDKYFMSAFDKFSENPINNRENLIEYFQNNINWLKKQLH